VLYEMVFGCRAFQRDTAAETMTAILREEPQEPPASGVHVAPELQRIIARCLEKNPEERFQSALDLAFDLRSTASRSAVGGPVRRRTEGTYATTQTSGTAELRSKSIAIMPFTNMSPDPDSEYLGDGITEDVINALANLSGLRVIARTSAFAFKGKDTDLREVGRKLEVGRILDGSVRTAGTRLRVTVQLIDVDDGSYLWSERYDRNLDDIFAIQNDIAANVAAAVEVKLLPQEKKRMARPAARNVEAYNLYLLALHHQERWAPDSMAKSIEYLEEALRIDAEYAQAFAAIGYAYLQRGTMHGDLLPKIAHPEALAAVTRALEIDERTAEAHATLGMIKTVFEWDWKGAEREFLRALELSPGDARGHQDYGYLLCAMGRHEESIREGALSVELDPLSWTRHFDFSWFLYCARRYQEAADQAAIALEIDRANYLSRIILAWCHAGLGRIDAATRELDRLGELDIQHPSNLSFVAHAKAQVGRMPEARRILEGLEERPHDTRHVEAFALIHVALGRADDAFEWLEKAYEDHLHILNHLYSPWFDGIRADPRFEDLLVRVGLGSQQGHG
jgi:serine/threonine-protein kinase